MFYVHLNHHLNLVSPRNQLRRLERSPKASSRHGRKVARRENLKITTLKEMHDKSMVGGRQIKGIISNNEVMKLKQQENAFDTFKIGQTFATTTPYIDLI